MNTNTDLVGKTISGVVAVQDDGDEPVRLWMLQFTDGSHVEFVSPAGQRHLRRATRGRKQLSRKHQPEAQLVLNVA